MKLPKLSKFHDRNLMENGGKIEDVSDTVVLRPLQSVWELHRDVTDNDATVG